MSRLTMSEELLLRRFLAHLDDTGALSAPVSALPATIETFAEKEAERR